MTNNRRLTSSFGIRKINHHGTARRKNHHFDGNARGNILFCHDSLQISSTWPRISKKENLKLCVMFLWRRFSRCMHIGLVSRHPWSYGQCPGRNRKGVPYQNRLPRGWLCHLLGFFLGADHWTNHLDLQRIFWILGNSRIKQCWKDSFDNPRTSS